MARTGRRPGNQDTREAIIAAAREAFAEKGYDRASIRAIATGAGVDPALVHHYFGTKDQLFLATVNAPIDPAQILPRVLDAPARAEAGIVVLAAQLGHPVLVHQVIRRQAESSRVLGIQFSNRCLTHTALGASRVH